MRLCQMPAYKVCNALDYHTEFPVSEAWQFYDILLKTPNTGVDIWATENSWEYFLLHLPEAPEHLMQFFDALAQD